MKEYHKLVRDKIPEYIASKGDASVTHIADDTEYWEKLKEKNLEEANECNDSDGSLEEIADQLEVLRAMTVFKGSSFEEVEKIRQKKFDERGGFEKRIILEKS
jgi:predicted house-cleaning noncanonical NTP pyrophosphatase (MazG superfamily)